jgi:HEAT repeat protein
VATLKAKRDVPRLIRALESSGDANVRRAAAAALGELGDARAVEPLRLALTKSDREHDWRDTAAVADALVRLGAPSVGPLVATLGWHTQVVRVSVAGALAAIGRPAVQPLVELLGDADLETRETAGQILTDIGADAVEQLIEALSDELIRRRQWAARILGEIGDPRAVKPLARALGDPLAGVRQAAARSLGEINDPSAADALAAALEDSDAGVRVSAALALAELSDPRAVQLLLPELRGAKPQPALDALTKVGVPAVEPMLAMLTDSKARGDETWILEELRSDVSMVLAGIGYPEEVVGLVSTLFAEESSQRSEAASELIRLYQSTGLDEQAKALIRAAGPALDQAREDDPA